MLPVQIEGGGYSAFANPLMPECNSRKPANMPDGTLLRMYPLGAEPRAGALRSDCVDTDSHWHFHDMHQLICAFEEAIVVESVAGRHLVPPQLAAWIPAGLHHRVSLHRVRSGSVFFTQAMVPNPGLRVRTLLVSPLMREMLREAMRWPIEAATSPLRESFFATMAGLCAEWIGDEADLFLPSSRDARVQRALDFTAARADATLGMVCAAAGLSERTLRRHLQGRKRHDLGSMAAAQPAAARGGSAQRRYGRFSGNRRDRCRLRL